MHPAITWKPAGNYNLASSRYRAFIPCQYLKEAGWSCGIFQPGELDSYKLVILQKDYYNEKSVSLVKLLKSKGIKTVLDLCDNDFYNPKNYPEPQQRIENLRTIIDSVDLISVSTPELGKLVHDKEVVVIDDAIDYKQNSFLTDLYVKLKNFFRKSRDNSLRIVWYGNNRIEPKAPLQAGMVDIVKILPFLEELHKEFPLKLTIISNSRTLFEKYFSKTSFPINYLDWNSKTFPRLFKQNDVCVIPIDVNPFTVCKTNNRLVLSILMGVPVIADKIPSYEEFSDCVLFSDWKNSLRIYATNQKLRKQHVKAGRDYILSKYSRDRVISQWSFLFQKLLNCGDNIV